MFSLLVILQAWGLEREIGACLSAIATGWIYHLTNVTFGGKRYKAVVWIVSILLLLSIAAFVGDLELVKPVNLAVSLAEASMVSWYVLIAFLLKLCGPINASYPSHGKAAVIWWSKYTLLFFALLAGVAAGALTFRHVNIAIDVCPIAAFLWLIIYIVYAIENRRMRTIPAARSHS